jgi:anti-anti-sigma factor
MHESRPDRRKNRAIQPEKRFVNRPRITVISGKKHVNDEKGPQAPLQLSHQILPNGETAVEIGGELDIGTADRAYLYVRKIIDRHPGPVAVSLARVGFCDARGLRALVRMANYAELACCPFRVTSPSARLIRLMRITGLDEKFLASR